MRLSADQVKEAILLPDRDVRDAAIFYFALTYSPDPGIMSLAIRAIEQYGWENAFQCYHFMDDLVQTDETIVWLFDQIKQQTIADSEDERGYFHSVRSALVHADGALLERHQSELLSLEELDNDVREAISERIWYESRSPEDLWGDLQDAREAPDENDDDLADELDLPGRIVRALARHPDFSGRKVLSILASDADDADGWLELIAIQLAGVMRLEPAIPYMVAPLQDAAAWSQHDECYFALNKIGGDSVVRQLAEAWRTGDLDLKLSAAAILGNIHTDLSEQTCLSLLDDETGLQLRCSLLQSVLMNFSTEGIERARHLILTTPLDPDVIEVRSDLLTCCRLLGETFPEFDAWQEDAKNHEEFRRMWYEEHPPDLGEWDEDWENEEFFTDEDDEEFGDELDQTLPPPIVRQERQVGRNDPCPCGSGKKFKKCCLKKEELLGQQNPPPTSHKTTQFPIGTVALYGPDDRVTTKIVAAVIRRPSAEPILERWVGTNIAQSSKIRRQIKELFDRHGVKSVAATDRNMGCPHEEGQDFPDGDDCPFCPYWAGKQGSNRHE